MKEQKPNNKYTKLLSQAQEALGRKEAVRLIHKADKERIILGQHQEAG